MALSVTYDDLLSIAATAVGLVRDGLGVEDTARLARIPNQALDAVCRKRTWPHLTCELSLTLTIDEDYVLLPADFESFARDGRLQFAASSGNWEPKITTVTQIRAWRTGIGEYSDVPTHLALGDTIADDGTDDGLRKIELWPTPNAAYVLTGSYRRQPRSMAAGADVPDAPYALHDALITATRVAAREEWDQEIPEAWESRLERQVAIAADVLLKPEQAYPVKLADVLPRHAALERGRRIDLDPAFPFWS